MLFILNLKYFVFFMFRPNGMVGPSAKIGWLANRKTKCQNIPLANDRQKRWANDLPTIFATWDGRPLPKRYGE